MVLWLLQTVTMNLRWKLFQLGRGRLKWTPLTNTFLTACLTLKIVEYKFQHVFHCCNFLTLNAFTVFLAYATGLQGGQHGEFPCIWASTGQQQNACEIYNNGNSEGNLCDRPIETKSNVLQTVVVADHVHQLA